MIPTSIAARRRLALLAQQQPCLDDNRQQQQEGSTDFQWAQDVRKTVPLGTFATRVGLARLPSNRMPARAPVIGAADDRQGEQAAPPRRGAAPRAHDAHASLDAEVQQA